MEPLKLLSALACLVIFIASLFMVVHYRSERRRWQNIRRLRQYDRAAWKRHRLS
jgi:hypothetical protein